MNEKKKDKVFAKKMKIKDFTFDKKIANVFDEMLERSVPFYAEMQMMVARLVENFAQDGTNIYDLGCSTGNTMLNIVERTKNKNVKIVGMDNSTPMLERAREKLKEKGVWDRCELKCADLNKPLFLDNPSVVILILTLQFVRPIQREVLMRQIYDSFVKNGCIIVIEKILGNDSLTNRLFIDFYCDYKKRSGYSQLEISQKREALENVLIPFRIDENIRLLRRSGFTIVDTFFQWYNFSGFLGVKE